MAPLPEVVSQAWDARKGPIVLATVSPEGVPNAIYATCVKKYNAYKYPNKKILVIFSPQKI